MPEPQEESPAKQYFPVTVSSTAQPHGSAFAPLVSRLLLVAAACGPGCAGLLRGRRAGWRLGGPEDQVALDFG